MPSARWPAGASLAIAIIIIVAAVIASGRSSSASRWARVDVPIPPFSPSPLLPEGDAARGAALAVRFECHRCHAVPAVAPPPREKQCVGCHAAIADGRFDAPAPVLSAWRANLHSLPAAPSLATAGTLLDPDWIARFLLHPHDVRPHLEATMPRLALSPQEATDLAAFLVAAGPPPPRPRPLPAPTPAALATGQAVFSARGCGTCHAFVAPASGMNSPLAPDLRGTRDRIAPDRLAGWIQRPQRVAPGTGMPDLGLDDDEALAVAGYVYFAPLKPQAAVSAPPRRPVLDRRVTYAEVRDRVFRKVCWHCHAEPDLARGDGGPGMTGGFGFPGRQLDLSTYEAVQSGYLDDQGEPTSVFAASAVAGMGRVSRLVEVLRNRQLEEAGATPEVRGMPLGLPALSPEDLQLVETWVAQGRPR
ncbi:MAG: c-type cytochrome [Myxococcota bacterium]